MESRLLNVKTLFLGHCEKGASGYAATEDLHNSLLCF